MSIYRPDGIGIWNYFVPLIMEKRKLLESVCHYFKEKHKLVSKEWYSCKPLKMR